MLVPVALVLGGCRVTNAADAVPVISTASVPLYPEIAQSARVQGWFRYAITTDGKPVTHIENLSLEQQKPSKPTRQVSPEVQHAYRVLAQSAEEREDVTFCFYRQHRLSSPIVID